MQDINIPEYPWVNHYPDGVNWQAPVHPRPMAGLLSEALSHYPDRPAVDFMGRKFTYYELEKQVRHFAAALQLAGVEKGTRIGLFLPNCPQFIISYYAILLAGGVVVNFNPLYSAREIEHQIRDSGVRMMVTLRLTALYPKLSPFLENKLLDKVITSDLQEMLPLVKGMAFSMLKQKEIAHVPQDAKHLDFHSMVAQAKSISPARRRG